MDKKREILNQKVFEIGYAVFRVTGSFKDGSSLTHYLENRILDLVDTVLIGEYERAKFSADSLGYMLHLGFEAGYISENIFSIIKREIDNLVKGINELPNSAKFPEIDPKSLFLNKKLSSLSDYIGEAMKVDPKENVASEELELEKIVSVISPKHIIPSKASFNDDEDLVVPGMMKPAISGNTATKQGSSQGASGSDRLSVILDTIKESGYCRLRDLQEIFPEFSERTIRYDIEKLANQGLIERVGNGGPATFYRIKREVS